MTIPHTSRSIGIKRVNSAAIFLSMREKAADNRTIFVFAQERIVPRRPCSVHVTTTPRVTLSLCSEMKSVSIAGMPWTVYNQSTQFTTRVANHSTLARSTALQSKMLGSSSTETDSTFRNVSVINRILSRTKSTFEVSPILQKSSDSPHPWISAALSADLSFDGISAEEYTSSSSTTTSLSQLSNNEAIQLYQQAHRLLDELEKAAQIEPPIAVTESVSEVHSEQPPRRRFQPEQWMEAEACLWSLSSARTLESVDLTFVLLDKLLLARQADLQTTSLVINHENNAIEQDGYESYHSFLTNWDLWHSVFINWHQVSKDTIKKLSAESIAPRRRNLLSLRNKKCSLAESQLVSPSTLWTMLQDWNKVVRLWDKNCQGRPYHHQRLYCTTSKALSLLINITGWRGRYFEKQGDSAALLVLGEAELAEKLLFRMVAEKKATFNSFLPSTSNLNMVLSLWGMVGNGDRALSLLRQTKRAVQPDRFSYNAVLQGYAVTGSGVTAEKVLLYLCRLEPHIPPDVTTWNIVLNAWARSSNKVDAAQRVEQILVRMIKVGDTEKKDIGNFIRMDATPGQPGEGDGLITRTSDSIGTPVGSLLELLSYAVKPDLKTFNTALSAWSRVGEADACAKLLCEMRDMSMTGALDEAPDVFSYVTVMNAFAKAGQPDKAEALSDEMFTAFTKYGVREMKPTIAALTTILDAYSRLTMDAISKKDVNLAISAVQRAQKVFQRMRDLNQFGFLDSGPDTTAYNVMLTCYLRCSQANTAPHVNKSAELADGLLQEMKQIASSDDARSAPDFKTYSIVIQAWLMRPDGIKRAIEILNELWHAHFLSASTIRIRPDDSLSLHRILVGFCRVERADIAFKLLMKVCDMKRKEPPSVVEPTLANFGSVLGALSRSKQYGAPMQAQRLVDQLEDMHNSGVVSQGPDNHMYRSLVTMWSYLDKFPGSAKKALSILLGMKSKALNGDKNMQPDLMTYNQVLYAFSRGIPNPIDAEQLLRQMYRDHKNEVSTVMPDNKSFNSVLNAWARCEHPSSVDRADSLFQEMQALHLAGEIACDAVTYNIMLNCLARTSKREGAERAEQLVRRMTELSSHGNSVFRPNSISYGCLIKAWIRANDPMRAVDILSHLYSAYTNGEENMKPQLRHFDQVSFALSASATSEAIKIRQDVVEKQFLLYPESKTVQIEIQSEVAS